MTNTESTDTMLPVAETDAGDVSIPGVPTRTTADPVDPTRGLVANIFNYLAAVHADGTCKTYDVTKYRAGPYWWQSQLPDDPDIRLFDACREETALLEIDKPAIPRPLEVPAALDGWLHGPIDIPRNPPDPSEARNLLSDEEQLELSELRASREELAVRASHFLEQIDKAVNSEEQEIYLEKASAAEEEADAVDASITALVDRENVTFASCSHRITALDVFRDQHAAWSEEHERKTRLQAMYGEFFALDQAFQREPDKLELLWGFGTLCWKKAGKKVRLPLISVPLSLEFRPGSERFVLSASAYRLAAVETHALAELVSGEIVNIQKLADSFDANLLEPWQDELISPLLRKLAACIAPNHKFEYDSICAPDDMEQADEPTVYNCPAIFVRSRTDSLWARDFERIIEDVGSGTVIPPSICALAKSEAEPTAEDEQKSWTGKHERILFPLPSNGEQQDVIHNLAKSHGVAVQGPPGTGKSHTIVNLIAHYAAHGKRVLITSEKYPALEVIGQKIRDDIPELIPFCISMLGKADSRNNLEKSIRRLQDGASTLTKEQVAADTERVEADYDANKHDLNLCRNRIVDLNVQETAQTMLLGAEMSLSEVGEWLAANASTSGWCPDSIETPTPQPLTEAEWQELLQLIETVSPAEWSLLKKTLPPLHELPAPDAFAELCAKLQEVTDKSDLLSSFSDTWRFTEVETEKLSELQGLVTNALRAEHWNGDDWQSRIHKEANILGGSARQRWIDFMRDISAKVDAVRGHESHLERHTIELPAGITAHNLCKHLDILQPLVSNGAKLGQIARFRYKKAVAAVTAVQIDDRPLEVTGDDIAILRIKLNDVATKRELKTYWNKRMKACGGPEVPKTDAQGLNRIHESIQSMTSIVDWDSLCQVPLANLMPRIAVNPEDVDHHDSAQLHNLAEALDLEVAVRAGSNLSRKLADMIGILNDDGQGGAHALWSSLRSAAVEKDPNAWSRSYEKCRRTLDEFKRAGQLSTSLDKLHKDAPELQRFLENRIDCQDEQESINNLTDAWQFAQLRTWFDNHCAHLDILAEYEHMRDLTVQRDCLTRKLCAAHTWHHLLGRITGGQKAALYTLYKTVVSITKTGHGKYDARRIREAETTMGDCREAVPVWIMPVSKVLQTIPPDRQAFDLLIVDESSQSDLRSLALLFRAKKILIVGDDKQVSPVAAGRNIAETFERHSRRFLKDVPNVAEATWGLRVSLYDKAYEIFSKVGSTRMLREHFRCVPEIINWCNHEFYNGDIRPMRVPRTSERYDKPMITQYVEGAAWQEHAGQITNHKEADAVVTQIKAMCKDPLYKDKTIGVIALQGGMDQPLLVMEKLAKALPARELVDRRINCGDARHFQGDERDIIILSLVVAPNQSYGALTKRDAEQRFNVAVSRARDQIWLFHSVTENDLTRNQKDLRYKLLTYMSASHENLFDPIAAEKRLVQFRCSPFHKKIYRTIVTKGYRAIPEFEVGSRRIDIVIEGKSARLAVECDGDTFHGPDQFHADLERQRELERAGFEFERIRSGNYFRDPKAALQPLWERLDDMRIGVNGTDLPELVEDIPQPAVPPTATVAQVPEPEQAPATVRSSQPRSRKRKQHADQPLLFAMDDELPLTGEPAPKSQQKSKGKRTTSASQRKPKKTNTKSKTKRTNAKEKAAPERAEDSITVDQIKKYVIEILNETARGSYIKDNFGKEILKREGVRTRGKPLQKFNFRVSQCIRRMKSTGLVREKETKTNVRIYLVDK